MLSGIYLDIDISDTKNKIEELRAIHTPENFRKIMYRVFQRTSSRVKTIVAKDVTEEYEVTQKKVKDHFGAPVIDYGVGSLGNVSCCIPIDGERLTVGGTYKAAGGRHGYKGITPGKRYKINAHILKSGRSTMPEEMKHQGGNPPFRNYSAESLNGVAFTRVGKDRLPIAPVVGLAVPQMPLNRARDEIQTHIAETMMERLEREHAYVIKHCR